jgi:hypothetical protein
LSQTRHDVTCSAESAGWEEAGKKNGFHKRSQETGSKIGIPVGRRGVHHERLRKCESKIDARSKWCQMCCMYLLGSKSAGLERCMREAVEKKNGFSLLTSIYDSPLIPADFHGRVHAHDPMQIIDSFHYLKKKTLSQKPP